MDSRGLTSFPTLVMIYDREAGTNFYEYILNFKRADNKAFFQRYGYYPVQGNFNSLRDIRDFILERGPESFSIHEFFPNPSFDVRDDIIKHFSFDKVIFH